MAQDFAAARMLVEKAIKDQAALVALRDTLLVAEQAEKRAMAAQQAATDATVDLTNTKAEVAKAQDALAVATEGVKAAEQAQAALRSKVDEATQLIRSLEANAAARKDAVAALDAAFTAKQADLDKAGMQWSTVTQKLEAAQAAHAAFLKSAAEQRAAMEAELTRLRARFA